MNAKSFKFAGGLDLVSPQLTRSKRAGFVIGAMNYEAREEGYRRIDGYERFDGRQSPSDDFDDPPEQTSRLTADRRAAIGPVPGAGEIRGVCRYADRTWTLRSDAQGIVQLFGSSPTGWTRIELGHVCRFERGFGSPPENGESLTAWGSETATVIGSHTESGSWISGTAKGLMVLDYGTETARWSAGTVVTVAGTSGRTVQLESATAPNRLASGSRFLFDTGNFFAQGSRDRMYGICDSAGPGANVFEFDGTTVFPLDPGLEGVQIPVAVAVHQNHLFVAYRGGSVVHSDIGNPRSFTAVGGAAEFGVGDTITGMISGYRDLLVVFARNKTQALFGASEADWQVKTISDSAGAMANTAVLMDQPVCLDDRGIRTLAATDKYGDLDIGTLSKKVRPLLDYLRDGGVRPAAAVRVLRKSQYRMFFDDGQCINATWIERGNYMSVEFMPTNYDLYNSTVAPGYPVPGIVHSIHEAEDSDGRERIFFTFKTSEYVYEMDRGSSFDGHAVQAYLRFPYVDFGRPQTMKRFVKLSLECDSLYTSRFVLTADFSDDTQPGPEPQEFVVRGPRSLWDEQAWSDFDWDSLPTRTADMRLSGRGRNVSVVIRSRQTDDPSHTFSGVTVLYNDLKQIR